MERIAVRHEGESPSIIPRLPVHFRETEHRMAAKATLALKSGLNFVRVVPTVPP